MKPDPESTCPYTGHKDKCMKHFLNCPKWIQIQGHNPNTGEDVNEWRCADAWIPFLMVENSQVQRETGAAVESFRNEIVKGIQSLSPRLPKDAPEPPKLVEDSDVT